jgi:hypothetical protein
MVCDTNCKIRLLHISANLGPSGSGSQLHCCNALSDFSLVKTRSKIFKGNKAGDTLPSRHVSSCDVTRAVGI